MLQTDSVYQEKGLGDVGTAGNVGIVCVSWLVFMAGCLLESQSDMGNVCVP